METLLREFRQAITNAESELRRISEAHSERRPAPDQWSAKEILGHLIDSASNNHRRFVEAQWKTDLVFPGYDQERWVAAQRYQASSWMDLITLWKTYNLHLAHIVARIPRDTLKQPRQDHNLDQIAWQRVSKDEPTSLAYLVHDYLDHLKAHLNQILANERS
jgi:hypothetical protein